MRQRKPISNRLPIKLDLAEEPMRQPLVEIIGNDRVIIENHRGVVQYECCRICVKTEKGIIEVQGNKLEFARMAKEQLVIIGHVERVCINNGGK